ncbi:MAG: hypothetical protein CTY35_06480 [Methylotenera sp.]|nr:MAG: hypothetical protein CTY35_06480 [Methylotenera sp.]
MKPVVALIEWFGPYGLEAARNASKFDYDDGLYIVIGKQKNERKSHVQYIGLASDLCARLNGVHHAIPLVTREFEIWLGEVVSPRTPGRKIKTTDRMLDLAEWSHAYFMQLPINSKKRSAPPDRPITVYNRWWQTNFEVPHKKRPHHEWPDLIDFFGSEYQAKLVWFGGQQLVQDVASFKS